MTNGKKLGKNSLSKKDREIQNYLKLKLLGRNK